MIKRNPIQLVLLTLKGMAMGAADVVPGVSGGTIAFISGIYEELITGINNINLEAFRKLKKEGFKSFWQHVNGTFFVFLLTGIALSILTLSKLVLYLLEFHSVLIWSFFFGLVVVSAVLVAKTIKKWDAKTMVFLLLGTSIAFFVASAQNVIDANGANWYFFLCGAIAICAMILPGISGSFILVLLGTYELVLGAIHDRNLTIISLFLAGCLVGILSFARLLKFLFSKYKGMTIALLTGFMIGSLYKVWPWEVKIGTEPLFYHSNGEGVWMTKKVLPQNFDGDNQLFLAILVALAGFFLVIILERFAPKEK